MTREEVLPIARDIAAGACAMSGQSPDYCRYMREGSYDDHEIVQAVVAALVISPTALKHRLADIRSRSKENVVELGA